MAKIKQFVREGAAAFVLGALLMAGAFIGKTAYHDYVRSDVFNKYGCQSVGVKPGTVLTPILKDIVVCPALPGPEGGVVEGLMITVTK